MSARKKSEQDLKLINNQIHENEIILKKMEMDIQRAELEIMVKQRDLKQIEIDEQKKNCLCCPNMHISLF